MKKEKKKKVELNVFAIKYQKEISDIKEKIIFDLKKYMHETFGFEFIAEWIDFRSTSIFSDIFLAKLNNKIYKIRIPSNATLEINGIGSFRRFDTVNMEAVIRYGWDKSYGYEINEKGACINTGDKKSHPNLFSKSHTYVYRDLLRQLKIKSLLEDNV